jgi:GNAT superfamily N-acetyltransferase
MAIIEQRTPSLEEFRAIADSVGWDDHFDWESMQASLDASLVAAVAIHEGRAVGTARVVGDGVRYFYVQDVMVDPACDGEGIATEMIDKLLNWIMAFAAPKAFVGLFASPEAIGVYEAFGFSTEGMTGMHL